jgi:hypothetical protein
MGKKLWKDETYESNELNKGTQGKKRKEEQK